MSARAIRRYMSLLIVGSMTLTAMAADSVVALTPSSAADLSPRIEAAAAEANGQVVRSAPGITVERVRVPSSLGATSPLWRVTVSGSFPPRALRYTVMAGGVPIGFGVPAPDGRALRLITADPSVLTSSITTRYGDAASGLIGDGVSTELPPARYASRMSDPASSGPLAVTRVAYNLGDEVFQPTDLPGMVELRADVHFPTGLAGGPYPLVMFMHGNHYTCWKGTKADYRWPCRPGWRPLPNFAGYDYIASKLASYGYVVVSVSANGVNVLGNWAEDTGMLQRGEVLEKHMDLWNEWNTSATGPFGSTFIGKIDMSTIGTMGHSRGGEGVVWNYIVDNERPTPYGIDAVLALAPVDFTRVPINEVPFGVILPYCDGDVWDLQGVHFFDDSRYLVPGDPAPKSTVTVFGANHNFFNTTWSPSSGYPGAFDDGKWTSCRGRLTEPQERKVGSTYIVSFFRRYLGEDMQYDRIWTGESVPGSIAPARTATSYLAGDSVSTRLDVARMTDPTDLSVDELGGDVVPAGMAIFGWCSDIWQAPCVPGDFSWYDVHMGGTSWIAPEAPGLGQLQLGWAGTGSVRFEIPGGRDVSDFDVFQFRAATNPGYWINYWADPQDLVVVLEDGDGFRAELAASDIGNDALAFPIRRNGAGHFILNQMRFPLDAFPGVNLDDIVAVELLFSRTEAGVINVSDLAFSRGGV